MPLYMKIDSCFTATVLRFALASMLLVLVPSVARASWSSGSPGGVSTQVFTPSSTSSVGEGRALLIVLHGCVQSAADFQSKGAFETPAEATGTVVALPDVPGGGVIAGCWDYYGVTHDRSSRHADDLLAMTTALLEDDALDVDPDQVYIAGLSSGATQALVMGCLAPELYAGVVVAAGPALGTESSQTALVSTTGAEAAELCTRLAGAHVESLRTQLAVAVTGTMDFTVAQGYLDVHAEMYDLVYGGLEPEAMNIQSLPGAMPTGEAEQWRDVRGPRLATVVLEGLGHAWPTGSGDGFEISFISPQGIDLAAFSMQWFRDHNRRVAEGPIGGGTGGSSSGGGGPAEGSDSGTSTSDEPTSSSAAPAPRGQGAGDTGCSCTTTPDAPGWLWLTLGCGAFTVRRRFERRALRSRLHVGHPRRVSPGAYADFTHQQRLYRLFSLE